MTTGTWPTLDSDAGASSAAWRHQEAIRASWRRGITKRGKPPRDTQARMLRWIRVMVVGLTLLVTIGWAFVGAAALIW